MDVLSFWRKFHHWLCQNDNFRCRQLWNIREKNNISVSVFMRRVSLSLDGCFFGSIVSVNCFNSAPIYYLDQWCLFCQMESGVVYSITILVHKEHENIKWQNNLTIQVQAIFYICIHMEIPIKASLPPAWEPLWYRYMTVILTRGHLSTPALLTERCFLF